MNALQKVFKTEQEAQNWIQTQEKTGIYKNGTITKHRQCLKGGIEVERLMATVRPVIAEIDNQPHDKFCWIRFRTYDTQGSEVENSTFCEIQEYLRLAFNNDYDALLQCNKEYYEKLDTMDSETENGNHKWAEIESAINDLAFGGEDQKWRFFQNSPHIELDL